MCFSPSRPCSGESGCTEISRMSRRCSRSRRPTPTNVPLVPSPATKCVMRPSVCSRISGAGRVVVRAPVGVVVVLVGVEVALRVGSRRAAALRGSRRRCLPSDRSGRARRRSARSIRSRSGVTFAGTHSFSVAARGRNHRVRNAGVAGRRVEDRRRRRCSRPRALAVLAGSRAAARSFTEPPGFWNSALA